MRVPVKGFTIDGEHSKDLDDALWIEENQFDRTTTISIHIADVSNYVELGSEIDKTAYSLTETVYFVRGNKPMIPRELAEDKLSLLPGEPRDTLTIECVFDEHDNLKSSRIFESVLVSKEKFSYAKADELLEPDSCHSLSEQMRLCNVWAQKLQLARKETGALSGIDLLLAKTCIDEDGRVVVYNFRSEQVVCEFMILANTIAAQTAVKGSIPFLYRNQCVKSITPPREKIADSVAGASEVTFLVGMLSNWFERATYNPYIIGHFALALNAYCHFTSPIRRYADLVNHRILKACLQNQPQPYTLSELEALAEHINTKKIELKEIAEERQKRRDEKATENTIKSQHLLDEMNQKDFSKVLKFGLLNSATAQIKTEIIRRLELKLLQPMDYCLLLFKANDKDLIQRALTAVAASPHIGITVLTMKCQIDADWAEYRWTVDSGKNSFNAWAIAVVSGEELTSVYPGQAQGKQDAKSLAAVEFLKAYVNSALVSPSERWIPPASVAPALEASCAPVIDVTDIENTNNHVGLLQEIADKSKQPLPVYSFEESEMSLFVCTCTTTWQGEKYTGQGIFNSKKGAKQLAAKSVLDALSPKILL
ncbi:RNB domain-containing ribonuclease [Brasilonema sp. UFV-L1]|uniref:RNB domain-containing ribonuclease n=1 Tax=Brasilonema sp. UFV-L1 TaxID=2234130 RepID=UPI00145E306E|nr:RNB domain-containing ribonuclease [Brasilonema sp. UFV-L1]NMG10363.1 hypothetical protein [Brasilonema sp. UFV-L1]